MRDRERRGRQRGQEHGNHKPSRHGLIHRIPGRHNSCLCQDARYGSELSDRLSFSGGTGRSQNRKEATARKREEATIDETERMVRCDGTPSARQPGPEADNSRGTGASTCAALPHSRLGTIIWTPQPCCASRMWLYRCTRRCSATSTSAIYLVFLFNVIAVEYGVLS
jgi:hypothetical protein